VRRKDLDRGDLGSVVVWRLGDALLAVEVDVVDQIVSVGPDGRARTRDGDLEVVLPPGVDPEHAPGQAVVVLAGHGPDRSRIAVAAEHVEGVVESGDATALDSPAWLAGLESAHVRSLVQIEGGRVAALLHTAAMTRGP
jgi:chemotaxis signal transduction protein